MVESSVKVLSVLTKSKFPFPLLQDDCSLLVENVCEYIQSFKKKHNDLLCGNHLYSLIVYTGLDSIPSLGHYLIHVFSYCGKLQEADRIFLRIEKPSIYAWSSIILAHATLGESNVVFNLYDELRKQCIKPCKSIYLSMLKVTYCSQKGKVIHDHIIGSGLERDGTLVTMLVDMYIKCGNLAEANIVFCMYSHHDVVSFSTIITGYTQYGKGVEALHMFERMQAEGIVADPFIYSCVLKACGSTKNVELGKTIHENVIKSGYESDAIVGNTLIDMYFSFAYFKEARYVFDFQSNRNMVSWSTIIGGYVQHGFDIPALSLYQRMQNERVYVNKVTLIFILKACCNMKDIEEGRLVHDNIISSGHEQDVMVGSVLVEMYAKCGFLCEADVVLESLPNKNVYSWNAIISGYMNAELDQDAIEAFEEMKKDGVEPDKATYSCILKACSNIECLPKGRQIHDQILGRGFHLDSIFENSLMDMYAKCGELDAARKMFDCLTQKDIGSWSIMISGYTRYGQNIAAFELYDRMYYEGFEPEKATMISILKSCGISTLISYGRLVNYTIIRSGFEQDVIVGNSLVDMYCKCGSLIEAQTVFQTMTIHNVVSWNALIAGYVHHGCNLYALEIFDEMQKEGLLPDRITFSCILKACTRLGSILEGKRVHEKLVKDGFQMSMVVGSTLVDMYAKCGHIEEACEVFDKMPNRGLFSWGAMIAGYTLQGDSYKALDLYWKMVSEYVKPDKVTLLCVLKACCSMGALGQGKLIHMEIVQNNLEIDVAIGSLLVDMYSKLGLLEDAQNVLQSMPDRNIVVWNAMIGGYAQQGHWKQAWKCTKDMQKEGFRPVHRTYSNLLAAFSHAGELEEGHRSLKLMIDEGDMVLTIEHLNCVIDLLGRAGWLGEAIKMLQSIPNLSSIIGWMSLLTACKTYGQTDLARACFDEIVNLNPNIGVGDTVLSNIYVDSQKLQDLKEFEELRKWKIAQDNDVYEVL